MTENILEKIIKIKTKKIDNLKKKIDVEFLKETIKKNSTYLDFKEKIQNNLVNKKI